MRYGLDKLVAAVGVALAIGVELTESIPLRELWAGALLASVWLWANHRGWLKPLMQAEPTPASEPKQSPHRVNLVANSPLTESRRLGWHVAA